MQTRVKICGITQRREVDFLNRLLPDFVGFVFAPSRRRIDYDAAAALRKALSGSVTSVGVFVGESAENVARLCDSGVIGCVQLHGDEDEEFIRRLKQLTPLPVIRAVRLKNVEDKRAEESVESAVARRKIPQIETAADYVLFDAYHPSVYGGSGRRVNLSALPHCEKPFFIAGGLTAENVSQALELAPFGVDVSGGVENKGVKEETCVARFIEKVRGGEGENL